MSSSDESLAVAEVDVALLRELLEAGNQLAKVVGDTLVLTGEGEVVARWDAALLAIGNALAPEASRLRVVE